MNRRDFLHGLVASPTSYFFFGGIYRPGLIHDQRIEFIDKIDMEALWNQVCWMNGWTPGERIPFSLKPKP